MDPEALGKRDAPSHIIPSALGPSSRPCRKRVRVVARYLAAVTANIAVSATVSDLKSPAWRDATEDTRFACQDALAALNEHRREHGC